MIGALLLAVITTLGSDPCSNATGAQNENETGPDRETAQLYLAVGDEARDENDFEAARVAYRQALRRGDPSAAARLADVCRVAVGGESRAAAVDHFAEGLALMRSGDRARAIAAFEQVRAAREDPAAALLEGVCEYELGHDDRARPLLEIAQKRANTAATASFFLGLVALRQGDDDRATFLLDAAAAQDDRLKSPAATLLKVARRDGRLIFSALTEIGFDSNVELLPDGSQTTGGSADGSALVASELVLRLFGLSGPYARIAGQYREQFVVSSYDLGDVLGAAGARWERGPQQLGAEYSYDFMTLGGSAYLSAHRLAAYGRGWRGNIGLAATYSARFESFLEDTTSVYSGLHHDAEAQALWRACRPLTLAVGYHVGLDGTYHNPELSYFEQGPLLAIQLDGPGTVRFVGEGRFTARTYDAVDPDLEIRRSDQYVDGLFATEIELGRSWTARLTATARRALSNVADFRYTKVTTSIGLVYAIGGL